MGRKLRIEYEGAIYHIIQRGNNKEYIFKRDEDKRYLIKLVEQYKEMMVYKIYGLVIMDNHYHFIIQIIDQPLQKIMHRINNKYSKYYNHKNGRTGHVFENRYKGIWVKDEQYLLSLLRYIHQNPVRAKICKKANDYLWSSDLCYRNNRQNEMIDIDFMLDMFTENRNLAIKAYKVFMDDKETEDSNAFENVLTIGEKSQLNTDSIVKETSRMSLDEILQEAVKDKAIYEDIKNGSRKRTLTIYKQEYIKKALAFNYTMKEIGENISISESAVFKMNNR